MPLLKTEFDKAADEFKKVEKEYMANEKEIMTLKVQCNELQTKRINLLVENAQNRVAYLKLKSTEVNRERCDIEPEFDSWQKAYVQLKLIRDMSKDRIPPKVLAGNE